VEKELARSLLVAAERAMGRSGHSGYMSVKEFQREVDAFSSGFEDLAELKKNLRGWRRFMEKMWIAIVILIALVVIAFLTYLPQMLHGGAR
jgi:hypothetical protein